MTRASKETKAGQAAFKSEGKAYPYPPSWLDRFTEWVDRLPARAIVSNRQSVKIED